MKCNLGTIDRALRVIIGLGLIGMGFYFESWLGAVGVIPIATAVIKWCPIYAPFGLSSCNKEP